MGTVVAFCGDCMLRAMRINPITIAFMAINIRIAWLGVRGSSGAGGSGGVDDSAGATVSSTSGRNCISVLSPYISFGLPQFAAGPERRSETWVADRCLD